VWVRVRAARRSQGGRNALSLTYTHCANTPLRRAHRRPPLAPLAQVGTVVGYASRAPLRLSAQTRLSLRCTKATGLRPKHASGPPVPRTAHSSSSAHSIYRHTTSLSHYETMQHLRLTTILLARSSCCACELRLAVSAAHDAHVFLSAMFRLRLWHLLRCHGL